MNQTSCVEQLSGQTGLLAASARAAVTSRVRRTLAGSWFVTQTPTDRETEARTYGFPAETDAQPKQDARMAVAIGVLTCLPDFVESPAQAGRPLRYVGTIAFGRNAIAPRRHPDDWFPSWAGAGRTSTTAKHSSGRRAVVTTPARREGAAAGVRLALTRPSHRLKGMTEKRRATTTDDGDHSPSLAVRLAISWLTNALVLAVVAAVLSGVHVANAGSLLAAAAVFGVLNTMLKPLLRLVTLPLAILTFGIAWFFVSLLMLVITKAIVNGFHIHGFGTLVEATLIVWVVNLVLDFAPGPWQVTGRRRRRRRRKSA